MLEDFLRADTRGLPDFRCACAECKASADAGENTKIGLPNSVKTYPEPFSPGTVYTH